MNTPDQLQNQASDPTRNVYVSASAGTGKTKILTDRFIRFAQSGVPVENILCLTFTNAAAHEMKQRIGSKLKELDTGLYHRFVHNYDKLQIKTIHSLCSDVLAKSDISFSSKNLIDPNLKARALRRIIHDVYSKLDDDSPYIIEHLAKYFDEQDLFNKLTSLLSKKLNLLNIDDVDSYYRKLFKVEDLSLVETRQRIFTEIPTSLFACFGEFSEFKTIDKIIANQDVVEYLLCFNTLKGELRKVFAKKSPELGMAFEQEAKRVAELFDLYKAMDNCLTHIYLISFFQLCATQFEAYKQENSFYEFDDLIIWALKLLSESDTALNVLYKLDMQIDHLLVDEAQDLSPLQWQLIKIITDEFFAGDSARELERTIFIVGDFKQSIYGFQGADPTSFLEAKAYFAKKLHDCGKELEEIEMHHSFRSAQNILKATDAVFADPMRSYAVTGQQAAKIYHYATRPQIGHVEVLELLENPRQKNEERWNIPGEELNYYDPKQQTAIKIAALAKSWVDIGYAPSDILILIRKRSDLLNFLAKELKQLGLQVSDSSQSSLSDELMVRDFVSVAKFILFPYDDFNTACLESSPFNPLPPMSSSFDFNGDVKDFYIKLLKKHKANFIIRFGAKAVTVINDFLRYLLAKDDSFTLLDLVNEVENYSIKKEDNKKLVPDKINILTVHSAKGLQAKKIILADSASTKKPPLSETLIHEGHVFFNLYSDYNCNLIKEVIEKQTQYSDRENMRLLYVAMTRAEDELYLFGWENNHIKGSWYEVVKDAISGLNLTATSPTLPISPVKPPITEPVPDYITKPFADTVKHITFTPTASFHSNTEAIKRGVYIHKLLMKLANNSNSAPILAQIADQDILQKVKLITLKHPLLFSAGTLNEVPVAGIIEGKYVFGQIDKLVVSGNSVQIIDIKTDELPPATPDKVNHAYTRQLDLYRQLVSTIYPGKQITCSILWFNNQELMDVA